jgi:hypothetical protein
MRKSAFMLLTLCFYFFILFGTAFAAKLTVDWSTTLSTPENVNYKSITYTNRGGCLVVGNVTSGDPEGPGETETFIKAVKFDNGGNKEW